MKNRVQNVLRVIAWIGLIGMIIVTARDKPISETLWINIVYIVGMIAVTCFIFFTMFPRLMIRLRAGYGLMIIIAIVILIAIAAVFYFWLPNLF